mgnify:CR=1 FL=1
MGKVRDAWDVLRGTKSARDPSPQWRSLAEWLGIEDAPEGAMSEATYYACMKILRESLGKMPLKVMRAGAGGGIEVAREHPLYWTLNMRPNPYMTASAFWSAVEHNRNHYGNAYVLMRGAGTRRDPMTLWILPFEETEVWYDDAFALSDVPDVYYRYSHGGKMRVFGSQEVMHFRSSDSLDGVMGIPLVDRLRLGSVVDGAVAAQRFQDKLTESGMTGKAVMQYTGDLSDEAAKVFAKNIEKYAKGEFAKDGVKSIIPLPVGASLQPLNIKLTDAQFFELKKYTGIQIASAFGIKPTQIGDYTKASYASAEAQQLSFYVDTMLYIVKHYEEEITAKAIDSEDRDKGYFAKFNASVILRADQKTQIDTLNTAVSGNIMTPNEARRQLDLPADAHGDRLLGNGNLIPLELAGIQYTRDLPKGGESE